MYLFYMHTNIYLYNTYTYFYLQLYIKYTYQILLNLHIYIYIRIILQFSKLIPTFNCALYSRKKYSISRPIIIQ